MLTQLPSKIARGVRELIDPPIIQFSPPRTGSTMVWNALRVMFPGRTVHKRHGLTRVRRVASALAHAPVVCTIRHPLDALASSVLTDGEDRSARPLTKHWADIEMSFRQILGLRGNPRVLILRYEMFAGNVDGLVAEIDRFFGSHTTELTREAVRASCDINAADMASRTLGDFSNCDPATQIHGRHVSRYRGATGYYTSVLSSDDLAPFMPRCAEIMDELGYRSVTDLSSVEREVSSNEP